VLTGGKDNRSLNYNVRDFVAQFPTATKGGGRWECEGRPLGKKSSILSTGVSVALG